MGEQMAPKCRNRCHTPDGRDRGKVFLRRIDDDDRNQGLDRADGLDALRANSEVDLLVGYRRSRLDRRGLLEHRGQEERVLGTPGGQCHTVDHEPVRVIVKRQPHNADYAIYRIALGYLRQELIRLGFRNSEILDYPVQLLTVDRIAMSE
jgi:hypothetical protein